MRPLSAIKVCGNCQQALPLDDFSPKGLSFQAQCKPCRRTLRRAAYATRTDEQRAYEAKRQRDHDYRRYGISLIEYERLVEQQQGRCGICGIDAKLYVDHDHNTGLVRGLLCNNCNAGIGMLGDDPENLRAAIRWLAPTTDV